MVTDIGKRGGTGLTTHGKKCLSILLCFLRLAPRYPGSGVPLGNIWARVESVSGGESEEWKVWLAFLFCWQYIDAAG